MPPTQALLSTTNQYLAKYWMDLTLKDNYFFGKVMSREMRRSWKGSQTVIPMKYQKGVASVAFNGYDLLPITQTPTTVNMTFFPTFVATNVALAGSDLSVNEAEGNGDLQTLKLMTQQMKSRAQDGSDDIGNFLQGDGSTFGGKAPMGLAGIVDNGADLATYGGLSRATYSGLNATVTASGGTISLLKVRTLWNTISDGPVMPDCILTDYTTWGYFEALQTPFQRNTADFRGAGEGRSQTSSVSGYADMIWDGMEIKRDKKVTAGNFYMLNLNFLKWHSLKWWEGKRVSAFAKETIKANVYQNDLYANSETFTWTEFIRAYNQGTVNGFMIVGGQLVCEAPNRNGVLTGITGY